MTNKPNDTTNNPFHIEAEVLDVHEDEKAPDLIAYTFGQSGRLLAKTELKEGKGSLQLPEFKEVETLRVVVGPAIETKDPNEVLSTLIRLKAPEFSVRSDQFTSIRFPIDRILWRCWLRFCTVRGTLLKRVGDTPIDVPVCGAEIEIYEVDPIEIIFPKIPDLYFIKLRDLILKPFPPPPPEEMFLGGIPFPPVPFGPIPDLVGAEKIRRPSLKAAARAETGVGKIREEIFATMSELRPDEGAAALSNEEMQSDERIFNFTSGEATDVDSEEIFASLKALSDEADIKTAANISLGAFKSSLLVHPELFRPVLCWFWPVSMQLVATATTDRCGRFRARFWQGCSSDTPDLYFRAFARIGSLRVPIYSPLPVVCHTWWDYICGSEVTLFTTSPFAITSPPCNSVLAPAHWVLAMAVGNTSFARVRGTSIGLQPTTNATNIGLTDGGAPFGGYIRLRFEFDHTIRTDLDVRYYQVRWRKVGSGNDFVPLTEDVWRHYIHPVGATPAIVPYRLGPHPIGDTPNLYELSPALPTGGVQWSFADPVVDTTSAAFSSAALAPAGGGEGLYQFELTLYNSAGRAVNANDLRINFVVPTTLDLRATIPTVSASRLGLVTADGRLVFQLHVDNNLCIAGVEPPTIRGSASAARCGLLRYRTEDDSVTFRWTAFHPHNFATFTHSLVKGAEAVMSTSGIVTLPGEHVEVHSVGALLGDCRIAGFAETVSVSAMATDGWNPQSQYSRHAIRAFALAPEGA
jgi:hypothetical protein